MLSLQKMGPVVRLGNGNLGGKARVLPFLQRLLDAENLAQEFAPHNIYIPETWVLTTQCFSEFIALNDLAVCAEIDDDQEIRQDFLEGQLPESVTKTLELYLKTHHLPLAVRSSALSEDTYHHATAGLFATYFVPNNGPNRLKQLEDAVKLVFASTYYTEVSHYMRTHSIPRENEEMAVALETVVGTTRGDLYYPIAAGVAQSVNYFPMGKMRPEDGVAMIVMGLGSRAVSGKDGMRFCPRYPLIRPNFQQAADILQSSQTVLDAVDLSAAEVRLTGDEADTIKQVPIEDAEEYGALDEVASVYDPETGIFYESLLRDGRRVSTFNRMLRESSFPLPTMLSRLLQIVQDGFGFPVEIEFAVDVKQVERKKVFDLVLLQARPLPSFETKIRVEIPDVPANKILLRTNQVLGHSSADQVRDIVFVDPRDFSLENADALAAEVTALNEQFRQQDRHYMLLGPGRWGSCNKAVGIPVRYSQIDQALLIAELNTKRLRVEPSQGTHFFHNIVSKGLCFLTVDTSLEHMLLLDWLRAQPNTADTGLVKLIRSESNLSVRVNAHEGQGVVYWIDEG